MSQYPSSPQPGGVPPHGHSNQGSSGMAIGALVCGVIGFCFPPIALVALILGIVFLSKTRDGQPGRGMALAGTILGGVGLVFSVVALLIAILLPALGAARRTARQMQNSTQLRGIHQSLVTYANMNRNYYPGLDSTGEFVPDGSLTGNSGDGNTPQARMWMLIDGSFVTPEYLISPSEDGPIYEYLSGPMMADNYSYAQLGMNMNGSGDYNVHPDSVGRAAEWMQTLNSQAVVLSDRNTGTDTNANVDSLTGDPGFWEGSVLWNDNHVGLEYSHNITMGTKYANGTMNLSDNLFEDETQGYDALLVHD